ncbi:hypothetical protein DEFDS_P151 (plasmid) [Deferribacter desulfuricans SSM1]|uniref:Uncharacterized protein n=1 Tax=Deferribacter desulfuricans (strain DSM 14783 / JCM 11476 / NBRC 101012 / SSM1) TaxID=639282 RepID=D3PEY0_DEFDS|nr:hypothetical protein [Deferribacter desulfuricans]BAI81772.1 hypothetical protein DEFDS_P151 [Deferribacter desulfuricans SSM1]
MKRKSNNINNNFNLLPKEYLDLLESHRQRSEDEKSFIDLFENIINNTANDIFDEIIKIFDELKEESFQTTDELMEIDALPEEMYLYVKYEALTHLLIELLDIYLSYSDDMNDYEKLRAINELIVYLLSVFCPMTKIEYLHKYCYNLVNIYNALNNEELLKKYALITINQYQEYINYLNNIKLDENIEKDKRMKQDIIKQIESNIHSLIDFLLSLKEEDSHLRYRWKR